MEFRVGGGSLATAADKLGSQGVTFEEYLGELDRIISSLTNHAWVGPAADEYAVAYLEWFQAARASAESLGLMVRGLHDASAGYEGAEEAVQASFLGATEGDA